MASSRVCLITDASSGFGLLLAKHAASRGERVIAASRNPEKLKLDEAAGIRTVRLDPNQTLEEIKAVMKDIVAIYGTIDAVVNNAGYVQTGILEEVTPEATFRQFQVNTFGPLNVYRAVLPYLREKKYGTLVTIGDGGLVSHAALRWLAIGLADEVASFGICHCLIEPGFFRTELLNPNANIASTGSTERIPDYSEMQRRIAIFLSSMARSWVTPLRVWRLSMMLLLPRDTLRGGICRVFALGSDATAEISKSASQTLANLNDWKEISAISDFPEGQSRIYELRLLYRVL
ncbi:hypothetical protein ACJ73_08104 [Blastomyces percursus]|uniref:Uncharacterized protein n=1 Tax=Blastomyces percursus TaxID=1658174 RepID=A0A1J9QK57_9EURO|nr:hypothetical protein ACJ73_08104 [Blastomyces percursus]